MCASFKLKAKWKELQSRIKSLHILPPTQPLKEVVYPFYPAQVIIKETKTPVLTTMRYSMTPAWSETERPKFTTYNARLFRTNIKTKKVEYIYQTPTWRGAFGKKNCVVPLHEFFESCHDGEAKGHMVSFKNSDKSVLFAAGIYDEWVNKKTGEILQSFAIITTEPPEFIKNVGHDRCPVFLSDKDVHTWLDGFSTGKEAYDFLNGLTFKPTFEYEKVRPLKGDTSEQLSFR